jgi:hypothetical protein
VVAVFQSSGTSKCVTDSAWLFPIIPPVCGSLGRK